MRSLLTKLRSLFKKEPVNNWRVVDKFWGGDRYKEDCVEYPNTDRIVSLSVVNGNVGHSMEGYYKDGKWWNIFCGVKKEISMGITVVAWREVNNG